MKFLILTVIMISMINTCPNEKFCQGCSENEDKTKQAICDLCYDGYFDKSKSQCVIFEKSQRIHKCLSYQNIDETTDKKIECFICDFGFRLHEGRCVQCKTQGCALCNQDIEVCTACFDGYKVVNSQPSSCSLEESPISNCDIAVIDFEKETFTCTKCKPKYTILSNKALLSDFCILDTIGNCRQIDPNNKEHCLFCENKFYLDGNRKCLPNTDQPISKPMSFWTKLFIFLVIISFVGGAVYLLYFKKQLERQNDALIN